MKSRWLIQSQTDLLRFSGQKAYGLSQLLHGLRSSLLACYWTDHSCSHGQKPSMIFLCSSMARDLAGWPDFRLTSLAPVDKNPSMIFLSSSLARDQAGWPDYRLTSLAPVDKNPSMIFLSSSMAWDLACCPVTTSRPRSNTSATFSMQLRHSFKWTK